MPQSLKHHEKTRTATPEVPADKPRLLESPEEELRLDRPSLRDWLDLRLGWYGFVRKNLDERGTLVEKSGPSSKGSAGASPPHMGH